MRQLVVFLVLPLCLVCALSSSRADEVPGRDEVRGAIGRAIGLLEKGSAGSAEQRVCFTCHNQALPILALRHARQKGFDVDESNLAKQVAHTKSHLDRGRENYLKGKGQGGRVITAGYALWALEVADCPPDETTAAVVGFLLKFQKHADHWRHPGNRPPSSGSEFATTYVALHGLAAFGIAQQQPGIEARIEAVRQWLLKSEPRDTEDRVFRLRSLETTGEEAARRQAAEALLASQREDGGWSQTEEMESDAYATGTVLAALLQAGGMPRDHPAVAQGVRFLLESQLEDGSWHVVTRAEPFQAYYESGFPHEEDQFISIAASSWATLALVLSL